MSRSANEFYIPMGTIADYGASGPFSQKYACQEKMKVVGVVIHHQDAADGSTVTNWELWVNGTFTTLIFGGNLDAAADTGEFFGLVGSYELQEGDLVHIESDGGDGGTTPKAFCTLVLKR